MVAGWDVVLISLENMFLDIPEVLVFEGFTEVVDFVFSFRDIIN